MSAPASEKPGKCVKIPHIGDGFLHGPDDDMQYSVDGVDYCGRCHVEMSVHADRIALARQRRWNVAERRYEKIDGVRVKFRTEERAERHIATATIWLDDAPLQEIATFDLALVERPGDPAYQDWVDAISAAFSGLLSRWTGIDALTMKRQKPRYKGE